MAKKRLVLLIIGILVLCGGLVAGLLLVQQNQDIAKKAAPSTVMYLSPSSQNSEAGSVFNLSVKMDTALNAVTGVDVRLNFDPNILQVNSLTQGSGIANLNQEIKNTYDNALGSIQYAVFTLNSTNAVTGSGIEVLKISATVKAGAPSGTTSITFDPGTAASASQEGQNVITSTSPATVAISSGSASGTSTPTAMPTNSPSPAPTSPGATQTPSPTPTVTTSPTSTSAAASRTSTPSPRSMPVSGTSWVSITGILLAIAAIGASIFLAI